MLEYVRVVITRNLVQDCGTLPDPSNGQVNLDEGTTIGSTAVYTCDEGHTLVGASTRMCQSDGVWANSEPTCQRKY